MHRAAHQILDRPRVFDDPVALAIVGPDASELIRTDAQRYHSLRGRRLRAFMVARSRYAEDELANAIERGATQYVILGAGLDTFTCRNPHRDRALRVFEVDHPATQAWKRRRIEEAGISIPDSAAFVPVDFEKQSLAAELERAGFQRTEITFFSWLGVVPYLTLEAAMSTLQFIASLPPGSAVAFDYAVDRNSLSPLEQAALDDMASRVARAGEPFRLFFQPATLHESLRDLGFREIEDLGAPEIHARYFSGRSDGLGLRAGAGHLIRARI